MCGCSFTHSACKKDKSFAITYFDPVLQLFGVVVLAERALKSAPNRSAPPRLNCSISLKLNKCPLPTLRGCGLQVLVQKQKHNYLFNTHNRA